MAKSCPRVCRTQLWRRPWESKKCRGGIPEDVRLPETNMSTLKNGGWEITFPLGRPIFKGYSNSILVLGRVSKEEIHFPTIDFQGQKSSFQGG